MLRICSAAAYERAKNEFTFFSETISRKGGPARQCTALMPRYARRRPRPRGLTRGRPRIQPKVRRMPCSPRRPHEIERGLVWPILMCQTFIIRMSYPMVSAFYIDLRELPVTSHWILLRRSEQRRKITASIRLVSSRA